MGFNECSENLGNKIDTTIASSFRKLGLKVATHPKKTILFALLFAGACASGLAILETENRPEKLWVPQNTRAEKESDQYLSAFPPESRFNNIIVTSDNKDDVNVLTKASLVSAMKLHLEIEGRKATYEEKDYALVDLCSQFFAACADPTGGSGICQCFVTSILGEWNYNLTTLKNDDDWLVTLNGYGNSTDDLIEALGNAEVDANGQVVSAEAFSINYSLDSNGKLKNPTAEAWEGDVFLDALQSDDVETDYPGISLNYISARSFSDEFGGAIQGDISLVTISYIIAFIFLGATLGRFCGSGSRWAVSLCALVLVAASSVAAIGISSYLGLFYGPVHSLLPFVLLGIGLDDVFVIVNAFNRQRNVARADEDGDQLIKRSADASARSGASITVTSLTDMVAFAISSSSALPALASFCGYATLGVLLLWVLAATFFVAVVVQDEKRQRANKLDVLCCFKRKGELPADEGFQENYLSKYFRKYHAPAILKTVWNRIGVLLVFAGLFAFGVNGAIQLSVEDSQRDFIPDGSYVNDYISAGDRYFSSGGTSIDLYVVFEDGQDIYKKRSSLAQLRERVSGLSTDAPYISEKKYQNVMTGLATYLGTELGKNETEKIGVTLQNDNWPATYSDFITTLKFYTIQTDDGRLYSRDIDFEDESAETDITLRVHLRYIPLTKQSRGNTIDDADKQIKAMDATRDLVDKWGREDELPPSYVYSDKFLTIEGFKIIQVELFQNAGLAIMAVGVITFISLGNIVTAFLITLNVFFCIVEILGFMYACGLVINSVSVINIVLAVGLSVDYSAHVGHCFMVKSGDRNTRATEALADIGASVLNGALSTFLAVAVLLGSKSYVFQTLSVQFALTVALGVSHGLILLPVLLSIFGPKPFQSAMQSEKPKVKGGEDSHAIQASNWNREAKVKDEKDFELQ